MSKYFLIGGKDDDLKSNYIEQVLISLTRKVNPKILFFPTANKDSIKTIEHFKRTFDNLWANIEVVSLFEKDYDINELDRLFYNSDIIYFAGGNTDVLVQKVKESNIDKLLLKYKDSNKIFAGISAGAILFTNSGMGDSYSYQDGNGKVYNYKMIEGLHILDTYICPHYQKNDLYVYNDEVSDKKLAFALEDDTAILLDNGNINIYKANKKHSVYQFNYGLMKPLYEDYNVHVLGPINTYSYLASLHYLDKFNLNNSIIEHSTIRKTVMSLKENDIAIVPLENSLDGFLGETLDLLFENNLEIIYDFSMRISFSLVSFNDINEIKKVYVQFKAKGQCLNYLENLNKPLIETDSNIESLNLALLNKENAAIVPNHMLNAYEFNNVVKDVCDKTNNYTRFVVLRKRKETLKLNGLNSSILLIPTCDKSGVLYNMLKIFNDYNINLNAIMSRPTKEGLGKYYFYAEFRYSEDNVGNILNVFEEKNLKNDFKIKQLGFYSREGDE